MTHIFSSDCGEGDEQAGADRGPVPHLGADRPGRPRHLRRPRHLLPLLRLLHLPAQPKRARRRAADAGRLLTHRLMDS